MSARTSDDGTVVVTGPGCEGRQAPSVNSGLSLAQFYGEHADGDATFYVRDATGTIVGRVERQAGAVAVYRRSGS